MVSFQAMIFRDLAILMKGEEGIEKLEDYHLYSGGIWRRPDDLD